MKLYDVLPDEGIFTAIAKIQAFPWADKISPAQMDVAYKEQFTDRECSRMTSRILGDGSALTTEQLDKLAKIVHTMFFDKWADAYKLFTQNSEYVGGGYVETINEKITHNNATTDTGTVTEQGSDTGKISAFDSADFADKEKTIRDGTNTRDLSGTDTGTQTREYTRKNSGYDFSKSYESSIKNLQSAVLCGIVFMDTNSVLASHIL